MTDTAAVLGTATDAVAQARQKLVKAEGDLKAARELAAESPGNADATRWVTDATKNAQKARADVRRLEASQATARQESVAATTGRGEITRLESEIVRLDKAITEQLHPPGGFTAKEQAGGRRPGIEPARQEPGGNKYHELVNQRGNALRDLDSQTKGLTSSLAERIARATPGKAARPLALSNAASLDPPLRPVGTLPIDVTTGRPIKGDWASDHIVSRTEIGRDPRFARLTPAQRSSMLHEIPENFLPMTGPANSSKLGRSVDAWITERSRSGQPLPADVAVALRVADKRARIAVEAKFKQFSAQ